MKAYFLTSVLLALLTLNSCSSETEKTNRSSSIEQSDKPSSIGQDDKSTSTSSSIEESDQLAVYGLDISHHQHNEIDSIFEATDSLSFVICKATEGVTYTRPTIFI